MSSCPTCCVIHDSGWDGSGNSILTHQLEAGTFQATINWPQQAARRVVSETLGEAEYRMSLSSWSWQVTFAHEGGSVVFDAGNPGYPRGGQAQDAPGLFLAVRFRSLTGEGEVPARIAAGRATWYAATGPTTSEQRTSTWNGALRESYKPHHLRILVDMAASNASVIAVRCHLGIQLPGVLENWTTSSPAPNRDPFGLSGPMEPAITLEDRLSDIVYLPIKGTGFSPTVNAWRPESKYSLAIGSPWAYERRPPEET